MAQYDPNLTPAPAQQQPEPQSKGFDLTGLLFGLGNIAGGIGQVQSGGRLPNVAMQMQNQFEEGQQRQLQNKMVQAELQMRQKKQAMDEDKHLMDKGSKLFDTIKTVQEIFPDVDDEQAAKLSQKLATDFGDETMAETVKKMILSSELTDAAGVVVPELVRQMGGRKAIAMFKKNPEQAVKVNAKLKSQTAFQNLTKAAETAKLSRTASGEEIEKVMPGALADLDEEDVLKLHRAGFTGIEPKGVMEARAKGTIESVTQAKRDEDRDRQAAYQRERDQVKDRQWATSLAELNRRTAESLAAVAGRANRPTTEQMRLLNNFDEADRVIDDVIKTHAKAFPKGGTISAALKGAILESNKARTLREAFIPESTKGLTDAERDWVAAHNMLSASLYKLTDERQLSETEGLRNLKSFDPAVSTEQYQKNARSRQDSVRRQRTNWEAMITGPGSGRTVPPRPGNLEKSAGAPTGDAPASGGRPRAVNPKTGEAVEFDGKNWVPVK